MCLASHRHHARVRLLLATSTHTPGEINRFLLHLRLRYPADRQHTQDLLLAHDWFCTQPALPVHLPHRHHGKSKDS